MRALGKGRILVTGSIAGFMPGTYKAVYNGTKAFIDSFSFLNEVNGAGDVRVDDVAGGVEVLIEKGFAQTMSGVGEQRGKRATATSRASDSYAFDRGEVASTASAVTPWVSKARAACAIAYSSAAITRSNPFFARSAAR
jgi:short-subunit dehydrogenase